MLRRRLEDHVLPAFADRILPFDLAAARIFATYRVPDDAPLDDALIAAVAQAGGRIVVRRNTDISNPSVSRPSIPGRCDDSALASPAGQRRVSLPCARSVSIDAVGTAPPGGVHVESMTGGQDNRWCLAQEAHGHATAAVPPPPCGPCCQATLLAYRCRAASPDVPTTFPMADQDRPASRAACTAASMCRSASDLSATADRRSATAPGSSSSAGFGS